MKPLPKRKKLETRFKNYEGRSTFFVTLICKNRNKILSIIKEDKTELTILGKAVEEVWKKIPKHFTQIQLGEYVLMPNHFHAIVKIRPNNPDEAISIGKVVHWFKTISGFEHKKLAKQNGIKKPQNLWQRGFNESWIGKGDAYSNIERYIRNNPKNEKRKSGRKRSATSKPGPA